MSGVRPTVVISSSRRVRELRRCPGLSVQRSARVRKCSMRWTGLSEPKGSWKTICTLRRYARDARRRSVRRTSVAVEQDLAGGGLLEPGEAAGEGALAAAGLADQRHDLALPDGRGHVVEGADRGAGEQPADW